MVLHAVLAAFFLLSFQVLATLWNAPLLAYNVHVWREGRYMLEPTDVFRQLPYRKRESFVKLGFFLLSFFYYLFRMVGELVA